MIKVNCRELTIDEQLALAAAISEAFQGKAVALVRDADLVLDVIEPPPPAEDDVESVVAGFISKRKGGEHYSLERDGETFFVHSADPLARSRGRGRPTLPDNLLKCPYCSYVTPYREAYDVHSRSHGFGVM